MVESTIRTADPSVAIKLITSSRGKLLRGEPIAALWEQRRAHIVGSLPELEDEMTHFTHDYDRARDGSPDRLDAMVFAATELTSGAAPGAYFSESAMLVRGGPAPRPDCLTQIFGTLVTTPRTGAGVGYVVMASTPADAPGGAYLQILDWWICEMGIALSAEWLQCAHELLLAYAEEYRVTADYPSIFIEQNDFGEAIFATALQHHDETGIIINLHKIERRPRNTPIPSLDQLVEATRPHINSGLVKFAAPALEREIAFRSANANHLLTQLRTFKPEDRAQSVELVAALVTGVAYWMAEGI
jgi:hypothetical protein